jgi:hypothetical protein
VPKIDPFAAGFKSPVVTGPATLAARSIDKGEIDASAGAHLPRV